MALPLPVTLKVVLPPSFRFKAPRLALGPLTVREPVGRVTEPILPRLTTISALLSIMVAPVTVPFSPTVILTALFRGSPACCVMEATVPWLMFTVALVPVSLSWPLLRVTAPTSEMMPLTASWVPVPVRFSAPISLLVTDTRVLLPVRVTEPVISLWLSRVTFWALAWVVALPLISTLPFSVA